MHINDNRALMKMKPDVNVYAYVNVHANVMFMLL